jgi:hypothetical protein
VLSLSSSLSSSPLLQPTVPTTTVPATHVTVRLALLPSLHCRPSQSPARPLLLERPTEPPCLGTNLSPPPASSSYRQAPETTWIRPSPPVRSLLAPVAPPTVSSSLLFCSLSVHILTIFGCPPGTSLPPAPVTGRDILDYLSSLCHRCISDNIRFLERVIHSHKFTRLIRPSSDPSQQSRFYPVSVQVRVSTIAMPQIITKISFLKRKPGKGSLLYVSTSVEHPCYGWSR